MLTLMILALVFLVVGSFAMVSIVIDLLLLPFTVIPLLIFIWLLYIIFK